MIAMMKRAAIRSLFEPHSVAVVGASGDPKKIGHSIVRNIVDGGYQGAIYPVNPREEEILGLKVYKSIEEIEGPIDLATIVIPARNVVAAIRSCAEKGSDTPWSLRPDFPKWAMSKRKGRWCASPGLPACASWDLISSASIRLKPLSMPHSPHRA